MLFHPRVIRGALNGKIQGYLHVLFSGGGHKGIEVGKGAQPRIDGHMAPSGVSDRPGGARIVRTGNEAIVWALAMR